jgi:hypothetical protein
MLKSVFIFRYENANFKFITQILKKLKLSYPELGLLSAFHELGICLWFQDHDYLRKIVILNPSWATNSAYCRFTK